MVDAPQIDELKELVKVSLQQTGVLCSIKAQLRAAVFKVVNDEQSIKAANPPPAVMNTSNGALAADLVREFLEYYKLHSSLSVLIPEAGLDQDYPGRHPLAARLGVSDDPGCPLLVRLLAAFNSNAGGPPAPTAKLHNNTAAPSTPKEEEEEEEKQEATPPPVHAEQRSHGGGSRTGELRGSPESPGDETPSRMQQFGERDGGGSSKDGGGLGTLAGMPSLSGNKGGGLGTLAGLPSLGRGAGGGGGLGGGFGAVAADEDEDEEEDDELTSTTRRVKVAESAPDSSPSSASADRSLEERQQRMLASAAQAEMAMKNRTAVRAPPSSPPLCGASSGLADLLRQPRASDERAVRGTACQQRLAAEGVEGQDLAIELSDNDISDDDIVEEEIEVGSDVDAEAPSPQWGPSGRVEGASLSESCTEVSVDDRSVDGSMALDAFDHVEEVSHG